MSESSQNDVFDLAGRVNFVLALRRSYPQFWRTLNEVWRSGEPARFESWCRDFGILDEWLKAVCFQTMHAWSMDPTGPNATLKREYQWYFYEPEWSLPDFAPVFESPYPTYKANASKEELTVLTYLRSGSKVDAIEEFDIQLETLEAFENRMRSQFERQLRAYMKLVRENFDFGSRMQLERDAKWTALYFRGCSASLIADRTSQQDRYAADECTVSKAVKRFAERIRLNLSGRPSGGVTLGETLGSKGQKRAVS